MKLADYSSTSTLRTHVVNRRKIFVLQEEQTNQTSRKRKMSGFAVIFVLFYYECMLCMLCQVCQNTMSFMFTPLVGLVFIHFVGLGDCDDGIDEVITNQLNGFIGRLSECHILS